MKYVISAIALVFAFPAAAQTAPTAQHQGHGASAEHAQHQSSQGPAQAPHGQHQPGQHQGHGDGCCADRNNNGRMDCCENMAQGRSCCEQRTPQPAQPQPQPQGHQGH